MSLSRFTRSPRVSFEARRETARDSVCNVVAVQSFQPFPQTQAVADACESHFHAVHQSVDALERVFAKQPEGAPAPHKPRHLELDHVRLDLAVRDELAQPPRHRLAQTAERLDFVVGQHAACAREVHKPGGVVPEQPFF
jgi:hypothetical protein